MIRFDEELAEAKRDPRLLRQFFWRAASNCRRNGFKRSAVIIANNIDVLADCITQKYGPTKASVLRFLRPNP